MYVSELRSLGHRLVPLETVQHTEGRVVHFSQLMLDAMRAGSSASWLLQQTICILGLMMERGIKDHGWTADPFIARRVLGKRARCDETANTRLAYGRVSTATVQHSSVAQKTLQGVGIQSGSYNNPEEKLLVKYLWAARLQFFDATSAHISVDSGQVGDRSWQLACVHAGPGPGTPKAAWAPPQALSL